MPTIEARRQTKRGRFYEIPQPAPHADKIALYGSVTTILSAIGKPALVNWAAKVEREMVVEEALKMYQEMFGAQQKMGPESWKAYLTTRLGETKASQKVLTKAGEIGTTAHGLIENELNKRMGVPEKTLKPVPTETMEAALRAFKHWVEWAESVNLEPIASEQVVWSHKHKCAGTLDLVARINKRLSILDWKTGKFIYGEAHLQNAAYRTMWREMGHAEPDEPIDGWIVRLPKVADDPKFEAVEADAEAPSMEVFLNVKALWEWQEEKQQKWEEGK
jgi:hypothetical protein